MKLLNGLVALFALYMLAKHGPRALLFVVPGLVRDAERKEPRGAFFLNFVNALVALVLLAATIHIVLRSR